MDEGLRMVRTYPTKVGWLHVKALSIRNEREFNRLIAKLPKEDEVEDPEAPMSDETVDDYVAFHRFLFDKVYCGDDDGTPLAMDPDDVDGRTLNDMFEAALETLKQAQEHEAGKSGADGTSSSTSSATS